MRLSKLDTSLRSPHAAGLNTNVSEKLPGLAGCKGGDGRRKDYGGVSAAGYERTIRQCHHIMLKIQPRLTNLDWRKMGLESLREEDVVFLDPPYPTSNVRSYTEDTVDYNDLVDTLLRTKFRWVLCGYLHPLLCRLGEPFWAKDVKLLCVRGEEEPRTECLWSNFVCGSTKRYDLPTTLSHKLRDLADAASLSFPDLDAKIYQRLQAVANDLSALLPYLLEMQRRLSAPGKRTDLRKGAPVNLTWTQWVQSKRKKLGRSLRTIQYMLRGKTEASKDRQMLLAQRHATVRQEPEWSIPDTPMEIASEMARIVLEMRVAGSTNAKLMKQRLELLAEHFLQITGQEKESDSITPIQNANRIPGSVTLTM